MRERTDLDKKPTWYLFLFANVLVVLGCAITWIMCVQPDVQVNILYVPTLVCNLVSIVLAALFMYFEAKNTMPQVVHFQRKWLWWYLVAIIIFVVALLFDIIFFVLCSNKMPHTMPGYQTYLIVLLVVTGVLTLAAMGIQRYARFKIDLDIYRRKHGEMVKKQEEEKDKAKLAEKQLKEKAKEVKKEKRLKSEGKDIKTPSSGLIDELDN